MLKVQFFYEIDFAVSDEELVRAQKRVEECDAEIAKLEEERDKELARLDAELNLLMGPCVMCGAAFTKHLDPGDGLDFDKQRRLCPDPDGEGYLTSWFEGGDSQDEEE